MLTPPRQLLAIEELHRLFIVHCDVKPDSVFLSTCGYAVLGDYGHTHVEPDRDVARFRRGTVPLARGTEGYMAPEVVLEGCGAPGSRAIGPKADVFSFGVVVPEMWTSGRVSEESPVSSRAVADGINRTCRTGASGSTSRSSSPR
jgi:serine/threonine protein kinase